MSDLRKRIMTPGKPSSWAMVLAPPPRMKNGSLREAAKSKAAGMSAGSSISTTKRAGPPSRIVVSSDKRMFSRIIIL